MIHQHVYFRLVKELQVETNELWKLFLQFQELLVKWIQQKHFLSVDVEPYILDPSKKFLKEFSFLQKKFLLIITMYHMSVFFTAST